MEPAKPPIPSDAPPAPPTPPAPSLEPWALGALIGAIVLGWCPLTAIAAIVAGAIALRRIRRSAGMRTGAAAAWTAMVLATLILLVEGWALDRLQVETQANMETQVSAHVEGTLRGTPTVLASWVGPAEARPTEAELTAFAAALTDRMGPLQRIEITRRSAEGLLNPTISTGFLATYERGPGFGNAVFAPVPGSLPPQLQLKSIEVEVNGVRQRLPATPSEPKP